MEDTQSPSPSLGSRLHSSYERRAVAIASFVARAERRYSPLGRFVPGPFEGWDFLWQPAVTGFLATCLLLAGGCFLNSPLKLDMNGVWFFGQPSSLVYTSLNATTALLSVVFGWAGIVLLMRTWLRLAQIVRNYPDAPRRSLWWIFVWWATPLVVAPVMFSRDVFSYAAQGEMTAHHLSPYLMGPFSLGSSPFVNPVDPLWGNAPAPYGPLFLWLDGWINRIAHHSLLGTVVGLRLLEIVAVVGIGTGVTALARLNGRHPGEAFVLATLNPITLITLIDGAHNDALMAALLLWGIVFARRRRLLLAVMLIACAAAVKAPAIIGLLYVVWPGRPRPDWRNSWRPLVRAGLVTLATLGLWTWLAGFGVGWVKNLTSNGAVRSWDAPVTALGLSLSWLVRVSATHVLSESVILSSTRLMGLALAVVIILALWWRATEDDGVRLLGLSLLVLVFLGPVVQPWYFVWGMVLLAATYRGREHFWLLVMSVTGPFAGLPGGRNLVVGVTHVDPLVVAGGLAILALVLIVPLGRWTQWSWRHDPD